MTEQPCAFGNLPLLWARVCDSYIGVFHAQLEASFDGTDASASSNGLFCLTANGVEFYGTIRRQRKLAGRLKCLFVGGHGGFNNELEPKHYTKPSALSVARDILSDCGEGLSASVDLSLVDRPLPSWKRTKAKAGKCLTLLLNQMGLIWRMLPSGSVWIGKEDYPAATLKFELIDEDWDAGVLEIAPDAPELQPGCTLLDERIRYVVHTIEPGSLRTGAYLEPPAGLIDRFLDGVRQEVAYSRLYPSTVITQNVDLTLQLLPDDPQMRGSGLDNVPIRCGLPGFKVKLREGARVRLGFDAGAPHVPYASLWDDSDGSDIIEVLFTANGDTRPIARVGDNIQVMFPTVVAGGVPITTPWCGIITGPGNPKLQG